MPSANMDEDGSPPPLFPDTEKEDELTDRRLREVPVLRAASPGAGLAQGTADSRRPAKRRELWVQMVLAEPADLPITGGRPLGQGLEQMGLRQPAPPQCVRV